MVRSHRKTKLDRTDFKRWHKVYRIWTEGRKLGGVWAEGRKLGGVLAEGRTGGVGREDENDQI